MMTTATFSSPVDIRQLADVLPFTNLDLSWCKGVRDVSPLSALTALTNLELSFTSVEAIPDELRRRVRITGGPEG